MDKIIVFDKINSGFEFLDIVQPSANNVQIFFHSGFSTNSATNPPIYDYTNALSGEFGTDWSTEDFANETTWIAMYIDCLDSSFFPSTDSCLDQANEIATSLSLK